MKNIQYFIVALFFITACSIQRPEPTQEFLRYGSTHKTIAILPFDVNFNDTYKQFLSLKYRNSNTESYWLEQSRLAGLDLQKDFFLAMVKQVQKGKMEMVIQDFLTTRKKLEAEGIPFSAIKSANPAKIARILGVDAVFTGYSEVILSAPNFGFRGNNDGVFTEVKLTDARSGTLLWQENSKQIPNNNMDSPSRLTNLTLNSLAKQQPYRKR